MKIGVISDTHLTNNTDKLPSAIHTAFKHVDMIIHAGDLGSKHVLNLLKSLCPNVKAVWGNMDPEEVRSVLPEKEIFKIGNFTIALMHGRGAPNNLVDVLKEEFKHKHVDMIIFGHSHSSFNQTIDGVLFFNPGSATDTVYAQYNSYGIIELNSTIKAQVIKL